MAADALLLDVGDDTGALVIYAHPELDGREVEILPVHASGHHHTVHNVVLNAVSAAGICMLQCFPICRPVGTCRTTAIRRRHGTFDIAGGTITEIDWR